MTQPLAWTAWKRRPLGRHLLAGLLAAGLATASPTPAWAHSRLVSTGPAAGATLTTPLTEVTLAFSGPLKEQFTSVVVVGPDGTLFGEGAARVTGTDGTTVVQPLLGLPAGTVRVSWRVVARDGDPAEGGFTFTVAPGAATAAVGRAGPGATAGGSNEVVVARPGYRLPLWAWLLTGGVALLVAAGLTLGWRRRPARVGRQQECPGSAPVSGQG